MDRLLNGLRIASLSLAAGLAACAPGRAGMTVLQSKPTYQTGGLDRLEAIEAANKYTILGDSIHTQGARIWGLLDDPGFLQRARAANVGVIAVEVPSTAQGAADDFAAGRIDSKTFELELRSAFSKITGLDKPIRADASQAPIKTFETLLSKAHDYDIRIIFADKSSPQLDDAMHELAQYLKKYYPKTGAIQKSPDADYATVAFDPRNIKDPKFDSIMPSIIEARLDPALNQQIADNIQAASEPGKNTLVMFGLGHGLLLQNDLRQDGSRVALVPVYADRASYDRRQAEIAKAPSVDKPVLYAQFTANAFIADTREFAYQQAPGSLPLQRPAFAASTPAP